MESEIVLAKLTNKEWEYKMSSDPHWEVTGVRTHSAKKQRIHVIRDGKLQYSLEQTSNFGFLISSIPLVRLFYECPFHFFRNGKCCGYWKRKTKPFGQGHFDFFFENDEYTFLVHSKRVFSLTRNGQQIAAYKSVKNKNFLVRYSESADDRHDIVILFAAFAASYIIGFDSAYGDPFSAYTVVPNDRFIDRATWLPADDAGKEPFLKRKKSET